jgi:DNA-binding MarR family transcriptional regulator
VSSARPSTAHLNHAHLSNVFGALCTTVADEIHAAADSTAQVGGAAGATLVALRESQAGESIDRLRRTVGLTPSGAVRLVDRLVELGLVRRRPGKDARTISLTLTSSGSRVAGRILRGRANVIERALSNLTREEQLTLARLSDKLVGAIAAHRIEARQNGDTPPGGAICRLCDFTGCGRPAGRCPAQKATAQNAGGSVVE